MNLNAVHATRAQERLASSDAAVRSTDADISFALRMADGDTHAAAVLFAQYGGLLYGLACCMLNDEDAAEAVVIGVFEAAGIEARTLSRRGGTVREFMVQHVRSRAIELIRARRASARTMRTAGNSSSHGDAIDAHQ